MKSLTDTIRELTPQFALDIWRNINKQRIRKELNKQKQGGHAITTKRLVDQLRHMGIVEGDHLMVHASMSKMGYLQDGPKGVIQALLKAVGANGTISMPSSPVSQLQLDYITSNPVFDVANTPSAMGAITEVFRQWPESLRSLHPTEPVCANGKLAEEFVKDHFGEETPYTEASPWRKLMEANGKILYVGVTLANAGTHLHTLEDAVDFKYPVYVQELFTAKLINEIGEELTMRTKVHNPEFSKLRRCDELIPLFEQNGVLQKTKLGRADCLLLDAKKMFNYMVEAYKTKGITMYTPHGETIKGYDD